MRFRPIHIPVIFNKSMPGDAGSDLNNRLLIAVNNRLKVNLLGENLRIKNG